MVTSQTAESFRDLLLQCRGRSGLTQRQLADRLGIHRRSVQEWEVGATYPNAERLEALIRVLLEAGGLSAGREADEAQALWVAVQREAPHTHATFDPAWFARLLAQRAVLARVPAPPEHARTSSPAERVGLLADAESPERRQDWGEAPDTTHFVARTAELQTLQRWVVHDERCRLVAVLGMGGIGKTSLVAKLAQEVAPSFERVGPPWHHHAICRRRGGGSLSSRTERWGAGRVVRVVSRVAQYWGSWVGAPHRASLRWLHPVRRALAGPAAPGVVSPEQWTEELALGMRTAVLEETNDVFVSALGRKNLQRRGQLGRRLGHAAISQFLASLRRFFRDLQTKAHAVGGAPGRRLPRRFDPREALATPEHVEKALAGSEPRDIALAVWQRLAIQAARLMPEDLGPLSYWPFSAVQALAFLWVSTARRPNELLRLRADCVRTQWEPDMSDEAGDCLPPGADVVGEERGAKVSYLHIPSSKYGGPGWIWIPKYTADAIARWQAERGQTRLALFDQKDREFAQLLFVHRGKGMGITFLNRRLIPLLCQKAGVDPRDAEGAYTAHRGRSARISMLHACGLELEDLAAYAIHKNTQTIKKYARRNPIHLHRRVARADTLSTVIEGLYDPDAAAQGAPSVRWFLGYDADGAPQFCGLPAHHTCPHRMDCSHCGLFIGGERAKLVHDDPSLLRVTPRSQ